MVLFSAIAVRIVILKALLVKYLSGEDVGSYG